MALPTPAILGTADTRDPIEFWACVGLSVLLLIARFAVRLRIEGARGARTDDWLCIPYVILHIANVTVFQVTSQQGGTKVLTPDFVNSLTDFEAGVLSQASKLQFVCWYIYPANLWALKFIALCFYRRLTLNVWHTRTLYALFWLSGVTLFALLLVVTFQCMPYANNWQIRPFAGPACTYHVVNFWVMFSFNVATDVAILSIPVSMLIHFRASWQRKIVVGVLLCTGIFMISTSIIRAVLMTSNSITFAFYTRWGSRELIVGHAAVSIPVLRPLFTRTFWRPGPYVREGPEQVELSGDKRNSGHGGSGGSAAASDIGGRGAAKKKPAISWESRAMWSIVERDTLPDKCMSTMAERDEEQDIDDEERSRRSSHSGAQLTKSASIAKRPIME